MSSSPIENQNDSARFKIGDEIKMRGPGGIERVGIFSGLLSDIASAPEERVKISDDLTMVRRGPLYGFEGAGAENLSFGALSVLMSAFDAGAETASDYLKGYKAGSDHPLYQDHSLTMGEMRAVAARRGEGSKTEEPTAADELLEILRQHIQPKFHHHVALGEMFTGGDGDDAIAAAGGASISGMDGNDWIDGQENLRANGGSGNDVIAGYSNARLSGGAGDDKLTAYDNATLDGGSGNDSLEAYGHARLSGGAGHDYISAYGNVTADGGSGNDYIAVYGDSTVTGGEGQDFIAAGDRVLLDGGTGNDIIHAGSGATVTGGLGDDRLRVGKDALIHFNRGDGADAVAAIGGPMGARLTQQTGRAVDTLSSARIALGPDIAPADVAVAREGDDLRISIAGTTDSLLIRNAAYRGVPNLVFGDGTVLSGTTLQEQAAPNIPA